MKTKTKSTTKKEKYGKTHAPPPSRRRIEERDLNDDDQNRITNAEQDQYQKMPIDDVEKEEEREKERKVANARGEVEN